MLNHEMLDVIAAMSTSHASKQPCESAAASAIMACVVGAATPMIGGMFSGGTLQERLLFSLVLAGACTTLTDEQGGFGCRIEVTPETLGDAFNTFTRLTGVDMRPHLPEQMVAFAAKRSLN